LEIGNFSEFWDIFVSKNQRLEICGFLQNFYRFKKDIIFVDFRGENANFYRLGRILAFLGNFERKDANFVNFEAKNAIFVDFVMKREFLGKNASFKKRLQF
jgi:hypothetical protein